MKRCPQCGRTYIDRDINFCLDDGELLMQSADEPRTSPFADDSPPTVVMNDPRVTNPVGWPGSAAPLKWQDSSPAGRQQFGMQGVPGQRDQTLPTISLVLAIISCFLVCCSGGIWLGLPAAIVGFLGLRNVDRDPQRYGGRGLAIGGMVVGTVTFLASLVFLFFSVLGSAAENSRGWPDSL